MYTKNNGINDVNWKQVVMIAIFALIAWQLTTASAFAQVGTAQIRGYMFAGDDQATVVIGAGIELLAAEDGASVDVAVTDERGEYNFVVDTGSYLIRNSLNDDILPVTVESEIVMIGMDFYNADSAGSTIGLLNPARAAEIFGHLFAGDTTEDRVAGANINLLYSNGALVEATVTDGNGAYNFEVVPGSYLIQNGEQILPVSVEPEMVMVGMDFYGADDTASGLANNANASQIAGYAFAGADTTERAAGFEVMLRGTDGTLLQSTTTDGNGAYSFDVAPGSYLIQSGDQILPVTLAPQIVMVGMDFYNVDPVTTGLQLSTAQIAGYVFAGHDTTLRAGGVDISLYDSNNDLVATTTTDDDGSYGFKVVPGVYTIQNTVNGQILQTNLDPNVVMIGLDFYNAGTELATSGLALTAISGNVYSDHEGTVAAAGSEIQLLNSNGNVVASDVAAADGSYGFSVAPGDYTLQNTVNDQILELDTAAGMMTVDVDFFNSIERPVSTAPATIAGQVFAGHDASLRVGGVELSLFDSNNNLIRTVETSADGSYDLQVVPGEYTLQNRTNNQILTLSVEPGMMMVGVDFYNNGESATDAVATSQILGRMYAGHDEGTLVINSPVELLTESGMPVIDANGEPVVVRTSSNGEYSFNVAPGTYTLRNTVNNQILQVMVEDDTVLVGVDFYNAAERPLSDVPLAVSLNNVGTTVSTVSIAFIIVTALLGIATLPKLCKDA